MAAEKLRRLATPLTRGRAAAQNALEIARFGGLDTGEEPSPYDVVATERVYRLRRYFPDAAAAGPPVVLVPPMMIDADVYDVSPAASAVAVLHAAGTDPWVVDFGRPDREEGGLERDLADHVLALSDVVERVRGATGQDVHLAGYSQGGMFCYQTCALRRNAQIASLVTFGSPVDTRGSMPLGIPDDVAGWIARTLAANPLVGGWMVPAWASRNGFRLLDPAKTARQRLDFLLRLHDREALLPRERQRRFLEGEGWVAWPGPALADFLVQFIAHNRMLEGGFVIDERLVTLADIDVPILSFVGELDEIAPAAGVRAIERAAPRAAVYEATLRAGHFGLVVGSTAARATWPTVAGWSRWVAGDGTRPALARPAAEAAVSQPEGGEGVAELAVGASLGLARVAAGSAARTVRGLRDLARASGAQLPRLSRLGRLSETTRISLALLLDEQQERAPEGVFFLWEDRAHTHTAAKLRIDAVVAGLLSVGVRQGEHVGVLMATRPSALVVAAALNRIGAIGVLLRPDGDARLEARLGAARRVVADPEHASAASDTGLGVLVLGGGAGQRDLGTAVADMERIDPDAVVAPEWYAPNPGRARDLAFVLFTGSGPATRVNRITNGRWALSAFGTASSAALGEGDTVYCDTPLYHSSSLLMSLGGAVAGGARVALAPRFDPDTFWSETRRYGVTVAAYTWTMLRELVDAPPHPAERGHALRLLVGSGMPAGLWERVQRRFEPARVVEFYASVEGEAILVNLTGAKAGCVGRPLPGAAEVRAAGWDVDHGRLELGPDGFARECDRGEPGMLLSRDSGASRDAQELALRSVFARGDAWLATGDLFERDADGDWWFLDPIAALVPTADAHVAPSAARVALAALDPVDLAVAYGVPDAAGRHELLVAAVTLRPGCAVATAEVTRALAPLDAVLRPVVVRVVDEIPVTSWYRPDVRPLRAAGVPAPDGDRTLGRTARGYRPLTQAAYRRLTGAVR